MHSLQTPLLATPRSSVLSKMSGNRWSQGVNAARAFHRFGGRIPDGQYYQGNAVEESDQDDDVDRGLDIHGRKKKKKRKDEQGAASTPAQPPDPMEGHLPTPQQPPRLWSFPGAYGVQMPQNGASFGSPAPTQGSFSTTSQTMYSDASGQIQRLPEAQPQWNRQNTEPMMYGRNSTSQNIYGYTQFSEPESMVESQDYNQVNAGQAYGGQSQRDISVDSYQTSQASGYYNQASGYGGYAQPVITSDKCRHGFPYDPAPSFLS